MRHTWPLIYCGGCSVQYTWEAAFNYSLEIVKTFVDGTLGTCFKIKSWAVKSSASCARHQNILYIYV